MNVPSFENHPGFLEKESEAFSGGVVSYRWRFRFPNNYGASVISGWGAYADTKNPFELAVLRWNKDDFELVYSTPITSDVLGHLSEVEVLVTLDRIAAL